MTRPTLLSFVGSRDPYHEAGQDDGHRKGPLLELLDERTFARLVLFVRPLRREHAERLRAVLHARHPALPVDTVFLDLRDATDHAAVLAALRPALGRLRRTRPDDDYAVSLLSGPPEVHACWVLLAAAGELPARLLNRQRTVHDGLAGPRLLRETDWRRSPAALTPDSLTLLAGRRDRWDDAELQGTLAAAPHRYFVRRTLEQAVQLSRRTGPLLIVGEPGTQKQHLAALVHELGRSPPGPLVIFNGATEPAEVIEPALFGEEGGDHPGKVAEADGGTLVLIKVQHVPAAALTRLLKATDDGHYYRGRAATPVKAAFRLIVTTDRDLEEEVRRGRFAAEHWRRLHGSMVRLPPLRERAEDIAAIARGELERLNRTLVRSRRFSPGALARLESHSWPSNISELRRVVEQAVMNTDLPVIQPRDLDLDLSVNLANVFAQAAPRIREGFSLEDYLRTLKHELVRGVLRKTGGNQSQAARLLGVTPQAVSKMLKSAPR